MELLKKEKDYGQNDALVVEDFRKWVTDLYSDDHEIEISNPVKTGNILNSSITFTITSGSSSVKRKLSEFVAVVDALVNRYPSINFPNFSGLSSLATENSTVFCETVKKTINLLSQVPFILVDVNFTDFLYMSKDYEKVNLVKSTFRRKSVSEDVSNNPGHIKWIQFIQYMHQHLSSLPPIKELGKSEEIIPTITYEEHKKWIEKVNCSEEMKISVEYDMKEGEEEMVYIINTEPQHYSVRRTKEDVNSFLLELCKQFYSFPIPSCIISGITSGTKNDNLKYKLLCKIIGRYLTMLFNIPYFKQHTFCHLFLSLPNPTWRGLVKGTQITYSMIDLTYKNIMNTIENMKVDVVPSVGLTQYKAYLNIITEQSLKINSSFNTDIVKIHEFLEKLNNQLNDTIEKSLSQFDCPKEYQESPALVCEYYYNYYYNENEPPATTTTTTTNGENNEENTSGKNSEEKIKAVEEEEEEEDMDSVKTLPFLVNRIVEDMNYMKAIVQVISRFDLCNSEVDDLVKKKMSLDRFDLGDDKYNQLSNEISKKIQTEKERSFELDNGVIYCYKRFTKFISDSKEFYTPYLKSKNLNSTIKELLTYYSKYTEVYRRRVIAEASQELNRLESLSGFILNENDDLRTSSKKYDLSHADFAFYVCYGIAGLKKDEINFDNDSNESKTFSPSILLHYPSEVELPNGVEMFCYPKKVIVKSITTDEAERILDSNLTRQGEHIFTITNHERLLWGCCSYNNSVIFDEKSGSLYSYPIANFFITDLPLFNIHFNVLHHLIKEQTNYIKEKAELLSDQESPSPSPSPIKSSNTSTLTSLSNSTNTVSTPRSKSSLTSSINNHNSLIQRIILTQKYVTKINKSTLQLLKIYKHIQPPKQNQPIKIDFLPSKYISPKIYPSGNNDIIESDLFFNYCTSKHYIFTLPIDRLFQALGCILTEHRVVVISNNTDRLTCTILYLLCCLYPFKISHIIIPILPSNMLEYLELPSLFLDGISDKKDLSDDPEIVKVNLDTDEYIVQSSDYNITNLPFIDEYTKILSDILEKVKQSKDNEIRMKYFNEFISYIRYYMTSLASIIIDFSLNSNLLLNLENDISVSTCLGVLTASNYSFFKRIVESTHILNNLSYLQSIVDYKPFIPNAIQSVNLNSIQRFSIAPIFNNYINMNIITSIVDQLPPDAFQQYPILNNLNTIINQPNSLLSNNKLSTDLYHSEYYLNIHIQFENGSLIQTYFTRLYFIFQIAYSFYNNIIIHLIINDLNSFDSISIYDYNIRISFLNNERCDNKARTCLTTINNFINESIQSLRFTNYESTYSEQCHYISDNAIIVNREIINSMKEIYNAYVNQSIISDETKKYVIKSVVQYNMDTSSFVISELIGEVQKMQNSVYMEVNRARIEDNVLIYEVKFSDKRDWKKFLSTAPSIIDIN